MLIRYEINGKCEILKRCVNKSNFLFYLYLFNMVDVTYCIAMAFSPYEISHTFKLEYIINVNIEYIII